MDDALPRGENIQPPGFGYQTVTAKDANGNDAYTRKDNDKLEKRAEIDPEAAAWIVRGAEMIAYEGKSPIEVARFFKKNTVGGRKTWADENVRRLYRRERLVGIEVLRKSWQIGDRRTGETGAEKINPENWLRRESPHLRILTDELADAVKRRLDRGASCFG
jgi:site-specific DNA recombinase